MKKIIAMILCAAAVLSLGAGAFAGNAVGIWGVWTSSDLIENGRQYYGRNAVDWNTSSCWIEGAAGYGVGESIYLEFDGYYNVRSFSVVIGWAVSDQMFKQNSRPKEVCIEFSSGDCFIVDFSNNSSVQSFRLPWTVYAEWAEITIMDVYKGDCSDTCISEITFYE